MNYRIGEDGYEVVGEDGKRINPYPISSRSKAKAYIRAKQEGKDTREFMTLPKFKKNWKVQLKKMSWQDILKKKKPKSPRTKALERAKKKGLKGLNKPQRLSDDSSKSHHVMAYERPKGKYIKFGQKGVKTNQTAGQRKAFKSRHAKNIKRGKMSAAYWADKTKWSPSKTKEKKNKKWRKGS